MPAKDGTGPNGQGPKTGRGLGNCKPNDSNKDVTGFNRGFGRGRGFGYRNQNTNSE